MSAHWISSHTMICHSNVGAWNQTYKNVQYLTFKALECVIGLFSVILWIHIQLIGFHLPPYSFNKTSCRMDAKPETYLCRVWVTPLKEHFYRKYHLYRIHNKGSNPIQIGYFTGQHDLRQWSLRFNTCTYTCSLITQTSIPDIMLLPYFPYNAYCLEPSE